MSRTSRNDAEQQRASRAAPPDTIYTYSCVQCTYLLFSGFYLTCLIWLLPLLFFWLKMLLAFFPYEYETES